jgi:DNA ligase (NAD+)
MSIIQNLVDRIQKARAAYYNGSAIIPDSVYDGLIAQLRFLDPSNQELANVGAPPSGEWETYVHEVEMGSLDKCNTSDEFLSWHRKYCTGKACTSLKLDGLSGGLTYVNGQLVRGVTRGAGKEGEDITRNIVRMNGVPLELPSNQPIQNCHVRVEILLTKSALDTVNSLLSEDEKYKNTRNAASGIARKLTGDLCHHLTVMAYRIITDDVEILTEEQAFTTLKDIGFVTPDFNVMNPKDVPSYVEKYNLDTRPSLDFDIDGIVVSNNSIDEQMKFGSNQSRPYGSIAYKFEAEEFETDILGYVDQVGNSGYITPVGIVLPVDILGATITRVSLHNYDFIKDNQIGVGSRVGLIRANDVIPYVNSVFTQGDKVITPPEVCPVCGEKTCFDGVRLLCPNYHCPAQVKGRISNWISKLGVMEWGETLVDKLVDSKLVSDVSDIYKLTVADLEKIDRMGKRSATKCIKERDKVKEIPLSLFIGALSIPMVGENTMKLVVEKFTTLEELQKASAASFKDIDRVGPSKAKSLADGLRDNKELIDKLIANGVVISKPAVKGTKLAGVSFCFTGKSNLSRDELKKRAELAGATVKGSVGKGLNYLVMADPDSTSSKAQDARKLGTICISEQQFLELI